VDELTSLTILSPALEISAPQLPSILAQQVLSEAAREFLGETSAWQETLPAQNLVEDQTEYPLDLDENDVEFVAVLAVWLNSDTPAIPNEEYSVMEDGSLELVTAPSEDVTDGLEVKVSLRPALNGLRVRDDVLRLWSDAFLEGAWFRLYRMPGKPWSSPQMAEAAFRRFRWMVGQAKIQMSGGHRLAGSLGVSLRKFC